MMCLAFACPDAPVSIFQDNDQLVAWKYWKYLQAPHFLHIFISIFIKYHIVSVFG